ncbi:MAG: hypothetical protein Q9157_007999, partial [Trypethelium eluteriae]
MFFQLLQQLCCILLHVGCPTPERSPVPSPVPTPVVLEPTYFDIINSLAQVKTIDAPPTYHDIITAQARIKTIDAPPPATTSSFDWGLLSFWLLVAPILVRLAVVVWVTRASMQSGVGSLWTSLLSGVSLLLRTAIQRAATNLSGIPLDLVRQYLRNRQLEHRFQRQVLGLEMELELQFLRHVDKENSLQLTIDLLRETRKRCRQLRTKAKTAKPMAKADGRPWRRSKQLLARHRKVEPAKPGAERIAAEEKPVEPVEHDAPGSPSTGGPSNAEPEREPLP